LATANEERQKREFDSEDAGPEEASGDINFRVGIGIDVRKVGSDGINTSGGVGLHEHTIKAHIEDSGANYRGYNGYAEEAIVHIEAFEAAISDNCPAYSNRGRK